VRERERRRAGEEKRREQEEGKAGLYILYLPHTYYKASPYNTYPPSDYLSHH
jgi:hypothetical protein